jgi:hypothetical protein
LTRILLLAAAIALNVLSAVAQGVTVSRGAGFPALPSLDVDNNATPSAFLRAAQASSIGGRAGETRQALEMAQIRLLDRPVPLFQTGNPSDSTAVRLISQAIYPRSWGSIGGGRSGSLHSLYSGGAAIEPGDRRLIGAANSLYW